MVETVGTPLSEHALHDRFLRGLRKSPDAVAIRVGTEAVTYQQAHELALLWAGGLRGCRAVGVLAGKTSTAYIAILAILYAGATVVPLRPDFPVTRLRQMTKAAGVDALVADGAGLEPLPELVSEQQDVVVLAPGCTDVVESGSRHVMERLLVPRPEQALSWPCGVLPEDSAYVLFTSGSTGTPKGVRIAHGSAAYYFGVLDERYDFGPEDVFSQAFDLNFDCSLFDLFCAWGAGATAVAIPAHAYRDLPGFVAEHGVTVWFSTPSVIDLVRRMGGLAQAAMPELRWSFFAGEALKCRDCADWRYAAPGAELENLYGPTELTVTIAAYRWHDEETPRVAVNGVVPIGAVHKGHERLLLDANDEPTEQEGELCVAGPQLTPGYLDPTHGNAQFRTFAGRRWYRTGDRVRCLDNEELVYLGRVDSQVQVQGWRVELAEVEQALRDCEVHDAVVVGVPGAAGTELFGFYIGAEMTVPELVRRLRGLLPAGVIPKHYRNIAEFPLNSNGKVDRAALAAQAATLLGANGDQYSG